MKNKIDVLDYASHILKEVKKGVLITTKANEKVNSMSVSWGCLGIEWNKNIFIIFIRENRYTRKLLDENPEFTVNIPVDNIDRNIIKVCGIKSGLNTDKIKELNEKLKGLEELKQASSYENMGKIYYLKEEKENAQKYLRDALDYYEKGLKKLRIRKEPLNIKELKLLLEGLNVK